MSKYDHTISVNINLPADFLDPKSKQQARPKNIGLRKALVKGIQAGMTLADIARANGVTPQRIGKLAKEAGVHAKK